jgi:hypothetical protein
MQCYSVPIASVLVPSPKTPIFTHFRARTLRVCSSPRSFLPLLKVPQGSRDFYIRAERASLPLLAPDMLAVRIQAIDGTRTSTLLDSQPCRPHPSPLTQSRCSNTASFRATATAALFFAFFPPRSQSRSPYRRESVSGPNGPKI